MSLPHKVWKGELNRKLLTYPTYYSTYRFRSSETTIRLLAGNGSGHRHQLAVAFKWKMLKIRNKEETLCIVLRYVGPSFLPALFAWLPDGLTACEMESQPPQSQSQSDSGTGHRLGHISLTWPSTWTVLECCKYFLKLPYCVRRYSWNESQMLWRVRRWAWFMCQVNYKQSLLIVDGRFEDITWSQAVVRVVREIIIKVFMKHWISNSFEIFNSISFSF